MGAYESGQDLLARALAKLPESQRGALEAAFQAAEAKDAVILLGDSALARSDYSKNMDTLRQTTADLQTKEQQLQVEFERLNTWYDANKTALDDYKAIKAGGGNGNGNQPPAHQPPSPVDVRKVIDEALNEAGRDYINLNAFQIEQGFKHYALFNEPFNAMEIANNPKLGKPISGQPGRIFSLQDAYNEQYGERVAAKQKEADDKRFNDEVERRLADERKKLLSGHPFPLRGEAPSVLDTLQTKDGPAGHTLDTAVAEYERLQATRGF